MLWCCALALAGGLPTGRVTLDVEAYGERLAGVILADTAALAPGVRLMKGTEPVSGRVELLTSMKVDRAGVRAKLDGGSESLIAFDDNGDGYLDASDPSFAALALFVDANGDGEPQEGEVRPLGSLGIEWISRYGQVSFAERRTKVAP